MSCETWSEKLDAYIDGELSADESRAMNEHLRGCAVCASEGLRKVQQKRAVQAAGLRFVPTAAFRARIQKSVGARNSSRWRRIFPVLATAAVILIVGALFLARGRDQKRLIGELVDQHVATLASANPVDVISSDRHTVKPWFAGKIPFSFNLPELQGSPFVLVGGRVSYLNQSPGAELIFRVRQHQISVFIFQERALKDAGQGAAMRNELSFEVRSWRHNGLCYFAIGDASGQDLDQLSELIKAAG